MIIDCAEVLGLNQTCDFWGDSINYRNVQDYTAKIRLSGDPANNSIIPAWNNMSGALSYSSGVHAIYCQGVFLGSGKVTNLSFEGGIDVNYKDYSIGFQILKSGDLTSMSTGFATYIGINSIREYLPYLNSLTESCQYSQSNNLTIDFDRSISFDFEKGFGSQITGANTIASRILSGLAYLGVYIPLPPPQYTGAFGLRKSKREVVDTINGNFSYDESYSYQEGLSWVHEYSNSLNNGADGITNVSEQGTIQATQGDNEAEDRTAYANSGWAVIQPAIFPRCKSFFNLWEGVFQVSGGCALDSTPYEKSLSKDYSRGILSYNYSYNNDATSNSGYYNSYEQSVSINDLGWVDVSVGGQVRLKTTNPTGDMDILYPIYTGSIRPAISGYANSIYLSSATYLKSPFCPSVSYSPLSLLNSTESFSEVPAIISYDYSYSDDPSYISSGPFRKIKNTLTNQEVTSLVNIFKVVNYLELPQNSYQSNLGILTNNIEMVGTSGVSIGDYKIAALNRVIIPSGEYWITSETYNFNPLSYLFSMNVQFAYEGYRAINNYIL